MKKKFLAVVLAGTITCLATCGSSFATAPTQEDEQTTQTQEDNGLIKLVTAELPDDYVNPMILVEGAGVVSTNCEDFDSSENSYADEDANLDVDFNGLGYISKEDIKNFQETGELTFSNLKADFDTAGLQWGMCHGENGYIQLVKSEKQMVENAYGAEEEQDVITYRGLYKIEDNEIKHLFDLDNFWTMTDENGVSVGLKTVMDKATVTVEGGGTNNIDFVSQYIMVITQPDGTRKETVLAQADDFDRNLTIKKGQEITFDEYWSSNFYPTSNAIIVRSDDGPVAFCYNQMAIDSFQSFGYYRQNSIVEVNKDGTGYKEIHFSDNGVIDWIRMYANGDIVWTDYHPPGGGTTTFHRYKALTGEIEDYGCDTKPVGQTERVHYGWFDNPNVNWESDVRYSYDNYLIVALTATDDFDNVNVDGYALFNGLSDFINWQSKTYYDKLTLEGDDTAKVIRFENDGKEGFMNLDGTIIATFDKASHFTYKYAGVIKDGKAYLVDDDMNTVSETVDADKISAVSDELFLITKDGKSSFVTFTDKATSKPSSSSGSSSGSSSNTATIVDYSDDKLGFAATAEVGVLPDDAILTVTAITDENTDTQLVYDICFKDIDGKEVQPDGTVTIKIPVPEKFKDAEKVYVYRAETDGTYTDMKAKVESGFVVFTTNHFSKYIVTTEEIKAETPAPETPKPTDTTPADTTTNPNTGVAIGLVPVILAGAVVIVSAKKRK